ncbi:MAG TPA: SBBP repeat-containing protein [Bryobacteraceae bacterium]|nr:SBBP repeat-containing protein [Bryobacteraceae bacterium]
MLRPSAAFLFWINSLAAAQLPLVFEPNVGQANGDVRFLARSGSESIALLDGGSFRIGGVAVRLAGANQSASPAAADPLPGRSNYFLGASRHTDIAQFGRVRYRGVYPGIDLEFHGREYDFLLAPGADPGRIRLDFHGASPHLDNGDLVVPAFRQKHPHAYQTIDGKRRHIAADFVLAGSSARLRLGAYDRRKPLVIDPFVVFATYLGGSGNDIGQSVGVDAAGDIYVSGTTASTDFPATTGQPPTSANPAYVAFVVKLSSDGTRILYSTLIAGASSAVMAVDASGNAYLSGLGIPPATAGAYQADPAAGFIAKLNPAGDQLLYSALINGYPTAIAIDSGGAVYVTGATVPGSNFPATTGAFETTYTPATCFALDPGESTECATAFVLKLKPDGSAPAYATLLGGGGPDGGSAIVVDPGGNAIVAGSTASANFPVTANAIQPAFGGGYTLGPELYGDAFVSKLNPGGSALVFSTYLGGSSADYAMALALDPAGNIYVSGGTQSSGFPTTSGAYETKWPLTGNSAEPMWAGFVAKIAPTGNLVYSTFLPSLGAIAVDQAGYVYLNTEIPFPKEVVPYRTAPVAILNPSGSAVVDAGGNGVGSSGSSMIALDGKGYVYETGQIGIGLFFATPGTVGPNYGGGSYDAYAMKIALAGGAQPLWVAAAVNAATQSLGPAVLDWGYAFGTVAPGEIVTIYGAMLGPDTGVAAPAGSALPTTLGGTSVLFNNTPAPLLYAQADQVNAIVPFEVQGASTTMTVEYNGARYGPLTLPVNTTIPGIFSIDASGAGQAAVRNQDGSVNSASNPAAKGSVISVYATGAGLMNVPANDGAITSLTPPFPATQLSIGVQIGGVPAAIQYSGAAPGLVAGAIQVNAYVPQNAPSGAAVPIVLLVGGYPSPGNSVTIAIQ